MEENDEIRIAKNRCKQNKYKVTIRAALSLCSQPSQQTAVKTLSRPLLLLSERTNGGDR